MGYSIKTSNYLERIALSDMTHKMSMVDPVAISVETLSMDSGCSLEKEFTKFILMNPLMVIYLTVNQVDLCHGCVCRPLT